MSRCVDGLVVAPAAWEATGRCAALLAEYVAATWDEMEAAGLAVGRPSPTSERSPEADDPVSFYEAVLLALRNGAPVGLVCLDRDGDQARLHRLWVRPQHRRLGLGEQLVVEAVAWARARGCATVGLDVLRIRRSALNLYTGFGFEEVPDRSTPVMIELELMLDDVGA